jgi:alpha/beta superfamily hydrolase
VRSDNNLIPRIVVQRLSVLPLWGCIDNRVLAALLHPLTHYHKFYVLRYNARGVGLSSGWKSFTGLQEAEDLRELVKCAVKRLDDVLEVVLIVSIHQLLRT